MQPRVFIPHIVRRRDPVTREFHPIHDFRKAMEYGQLVTILDQDDDPRMVGRHALKIKKAMSDFTHEDFFVAVGDPAIILACGMCLPKNTIVNVLKWEKTMDTYIKVEVRV